MMNKLPSNLLKVVLHAAETNFDKNETTIKKLSKKDLYMLAFTNGYESAWSVYTDEDEEVLNQYDE